MGLWDKVEDAFDGMKEVAADLTTLNVVTMSGKIDVVNAQGNSKDLPALRAAHAEAQAALDSAAENAPNRDALTTAVDEAADAVADAENGNKINLKSLYKKIESGVAQFELEIVAFSHMDFDQDTLNYVRSNLTVEQQALIQAHNETLRAAQETRAGMLRAIKALF